MLLPIPMKIKQTSPLNGEVFSLKVIDLRLLLR